MKNNYNQDFSYNNSLNFFSSTNPSTQTAQKNVRPYDSQQVKAQIESAVDTHPIQPQVFAYNTQQSSAYISQQNSQKQVANSQQSYNQPLNQNFNNGNNMNKNQQVYNNRQSKGQNCNNNTSSGNSNINGSNTTTMRAGDWICLICNNLNFSFRNECNRCRIQTKQQNYIQNMMMCSQDKLNSTFNHQLVIPTPQLINYEVAQQQQQQNHQMYQRIQQQQQMHCKSNSQNQQYQNQQFQQPFIPLLNMNLKRANSEKENKEPQPSFSNTNGAALGTQINMVNTNSANPNILQKSQNQDAQFSKGAFSNSYAANQGDNLNTSFQFNQSLQSDCINLNTPQFFYPNNNQKFNELKLSQYQYLQNQNQQQLYNSSQISKLNDLNNQQQFKQHFQYNFNQISNQLQQQQSNQFESQNFQLPFQFKQVISSSQQLENNNSSQIDGSLLHSQQEMYKQRQIHFMMYQQQLLLQQQKNPAAAAQNLGQIPNLLNYPQISSQPQQNELSSQYQYPQQIHNNMQQFLIDNNPQRNHMTEPQRQDEDTQNQLMSDQIQNQQSYPSQQQYGNQQIKFQAICENDKQFEYQLNPKEESIQKQSILFQLEQKQHQQNFYFPHQINYLQKSMVSQQPQGLTLNNINVIQKPPNAFQQQQQQQQLSWDQQISQGVNKGCRSQVNKTFSNASFSNQEQNFEINNNTYQSLPQLLNHTVNSQNSLNLWSGPQKGYENRLLVTPPKAKQFQQQNLPLSDIENLITQFKLMYSTEKKSQAKSVQSDNKSESHSNFFGSTQKDIPNLNINSQEDNIYEKGVIQIQNQANQTENSKSPEKIAKQINFNEDNSEEKDGTDNQEILNLKQNIPIQETNKYIEKQLIPANQQNYKLKRQQTSQNLDDDKDEDETVSKICDKNSLEFQQLVIIQQENCKDCENINQTEQNTDVSLISTQILSKQSTREKCEKYLFSEEIIATPLKQIEDPNTEDASLQLQSHSNNNSQAKQIISQID